MVNPILESVIEMTSQRETDSLEFSLLVTISELVACQRISLFKMIDEECLEKLHELYLDSVSGTYRWMDELPEEITIAQLKTPIPRIGPLIQEESPGKWLGLFPFFREQALAGYISLVSEVNLSECQPILEGFVRIYENYLTILNENEKDMLTGLLNRRSFERRLDSLLQVQKQRGESAGLARVRANRRKFEKDASAWLVALDVDHFKRVNDVHGHICGDEVLLSLAHLMRSFFRRSDLLFRFGGEEFVVVLSPITQPNAEAALERFRRIVSEHQFPLVDHITVSMGYEKIGPEDFPRMVLEKADRALYFAKAHGRNCVKHYSHLIETGQLNAVETSSTVDLFD